MKAAKKAHSEVSPRSWWNLGRFLQYPRIADLLLVPGPAVARRNVRETVWTESKLEGHRILCEAVFHPLK